MSRAGTTKIRRRLTPQCGATQRENLKDNRYRARLFFVGAVLVIFGFLGQTLGSLPYGIPFFGFGNCSAVAG